MNYKMGGVTYDVQLLASDEVKTALANGVKVYTIGARYFIGPVSTLKVLATELREELRRVKE